MTFPFKGIVAERPYPPTGLSTARWKTEVAIAYVPFRWLYLTQTGVRIMPLFGVDARPESDTYPHVVEYDDELYLEDGHHRVTREALTTIHEGMIMRVFTIPDPR